MSAASMMSGSAGRPSLGRQSAREVGGSPAGSAGGYVNSRESPGVPQEPRRHVPCANDPSKSAAGYCPELNIALSHDSFEQLRSQPALKHITLVGLHEMDSKQIRDPLGDPYTMYDCDLQKPIPTRAKWVGESKDHRVISIEEASQQLRSDLRSQVAMLNDQISSMRVASGQVDKLLFAIEQASTDTRQRIEDFFGSFHEQLEKKRKALLAELEEVKKDKTAPLKMLNERLPQVMERVREACDRCSSGLLGSDLEVLFRQAELRATLQANQARVSWAPDLLGQLRGRFEFECEDSFMFLDQCSRIIHKRDPDLDRACSLVETLIGANPVPHEPGDKNKSYAFGHIAGDERSHSESSKYPGLQGRGSQDDPQDHFGKGLGSQERPDDNFSKGSGLQDKPEDIFRAAAPSEDWSFSKPGGPAFATGSGGGLSMSDRAARSGLEIGREQGWTSFDDPARPVPLGMGGGDGNDRIEASTMARGLPAERKFDQAFCQSSALTLSHGATRVTRRQPQTMSGIAVAADLLYLGGHVEFKIEELNPYLPGSAWIGVTPVRSIATIGEHAVYLDLSSGTVYSEEVEIATVHRSNSEPQSSSEILVAEGDVMTISFTHDKALTFFINRKPLCDPIRGVPDLAYPFVNVQGKVVAITLL